MVAVLVTLLALSAMVPYADTVTAIIRVPSGIVVSTRSGRVRLLKHDGDAVRAGEAIAEIEAPAKEIEASAVAVLPARSVRGVHPPAPVVVRFQTARGAIEIAGVLVAMYPSTDANVRAVVTMRHAPAGLPGTVTIRTQERLLQHILRLAREK
jgi:hypothetical protein